MDTVFKMKDSGKKDNIVGALICLAAAVLLTLLFASMMASTIKNQVEITVNVFLIYLIMAWLIYVFASVAYKVVFDPERPYLVDLYSFTILNIALFLALVFAAYALLTSDFPIEGIGGLIHLPLLAGWNLWGFRTIANRIRSTVQA